MSHNSNIGGVAENDVDASEDIEMTESVVDQPPPVPLTPAKDSTSSQTTRVKP